MNKVFLVGNLVKDVEIKEVGENTKGSFRLAVNGIKDKTLFFDCTCWNKTADFMRGYTNKGAKVYVEGAIDIYQKKNEDGSFAGEKYFINVVSVEIISKPNATKNEDRINESEKNFTQKVSQNQNTKQEDKQNSFSSVEQQVEDDDLPF